MGFLLEASRERLVQVMFRVTYRGAVWFQPALDAHQVIADLAFVGIQGVAIRRAVKGEF